MRAQKELSRAIFKDGFYSLKPLIQDTSPDKSVKLLITIETAGIKKHFAKTSDPGHLGYGYKVQKKGSASEGAKC